MSHLNISFPGFDSSRTHVGQGRLLRETHLNLKVLTKAVLSALNLKISDLTTEQMGQELTDSKHTACEQDKARGCANRKGEAEYQHLVELGQWHERRQRRRNR